MDRYFKIFQFFFKSVQCKEKGRLSGLMSIDRLGIVMSIICPQLGGEYTVNGVLESRLLR